jgi:hypothetical protein
VDGKRLKFELPNHDFFFFLSSCDESRGLVLFVPSLVFLELNESEINTIIQRCLF